MTEEELLNKVKTGLGVTGTYQDETLKLYIDNVKKFLLDAGVSEDLVNGSDSVGVIIRGVSDLWNYGMGTAEFSQYFIQRAVQLVYKVKIGEIAVVSFPGSSVGYSKITVTDGSPGAKYRYDFTDKIPDFEADLSKWELWDGVSEIPGEDGHKICIVEVTEKNLAISAGVTTMNVCLG